MNLNGLFNMLAQMLVRSAMDAGVDYAARRGKPEAEMTPEEREQAKKARDLAAHAVHHRHLVVGAGRGGHEAHEDVGLVGAAAAGVTRGRARGGDGVRHAGEGAHLAGDALREKRGLLEGGALGRANDHVEARLVVRVQYCFSIAAKIGAGHGYNMSFVAGHQLSNVLAKLVAGVGRDMVKLVHGDQKIVE